MSFRSSLSEYNNNEQHSSIIYKRTTFLTVAAASYNATVPLWPPFNRARFYWSLAWKRSPQHFSVRTFSPSHSAYDSHLLMISTGIHQGPVVGDNPSCGIIDVAWMHVCSAVQVSIPHGNVLLLIGSLQAPWLRCNLINNKSRWPNVGCCKKILLSAIHYKTPAVHPGKKRRRKRDSYSKYQNPCLPNEWNSRTNVHSADRHPFCNVSGRIFQ